MSIEQLSGDSPISAAKSLPDPVLRELNSAVPARMGFTQAAELINVSALMRSQLGGRTYFFPALRENAVPSQIAEETDHRGVNLRRPLLLGPVAAARQHDCPP